MVNPPKMYRRPRGAQLTLPPFNPNPELSVSQRTRDWKLRQKRRRSVVPRRRPVNRLRIKPRNRLTQQSRTGGYTQWEEESKTSKMNKYTVSKLTKAMQMLTANKEKTIYRWNGVKNFDDNGAYWLSNIVSGGNRLMPVYSFDITSCINWRNGASITAEPLSQMYLDAGGQVWFFAKDGRNATDTAFGPQLLKEQAPQNQVSVVSPHNKSWLKWVSMKMNLWGCKSRSTKFTVQLVQYNDDTVIPHHTQVPTEKRTSIFQNIVKTKAYNPIASSAAGLHKKEYKILKSETFVIQPTSTTETDQDPHVKTVNWFLRYDRIIDYVEKATNLTTQGDTADQADFAINTGDQNNCYTSPKKRIYLLVMATNFGIDAAETNADTPSFDLVARMCHESFH